MVEDALWRLGAQRATVPMVVSSIFRSMNEPVLVTLCPDARDDLPRLVALLEGLGLR